MEIKDKIDARHILQTVACQVQHTPYSNRSTFLALRVYLHQWQGSYKEVLHSLQEAEDALKWDHPTNFSRHVLVTYGNYAWLYYLLSNYDLVERYLDRIYKACQSLSSPELYSALIPEVQTQEGWSLLAVGFRNADEAERCFQAALRGDPSNMEFQAGLAISVFASWTCSWTDDSRSKAKRLMEELMEGNDVLKVHFASLLQDSEPQRASQFVEEVVQNSLNPEVLRNAARVCRVQSPSKAISILKRAIALDPGYHLLHYDLGVLYKKQMQEAAPEEKGNMVAAAMESFKRAVESDPELVFAKLNLAKVYGEQTPAYKEEMYLNLMEELPHTSQRCQQAIYLHWGDFSKERDRSPRPWKCTRQALQSWGAMYGSKNS